MNHFCSRIKVCIFTVALELAVGEKCFLVLLCARYVLAAHKKKISLIFREMSGWHSDERLGQQDLWQCWKCDSECPETTTLKISRAGPVGKLTINNWLLLQWFVAGVELRLKVHRYEPRHCRTQSIPKATANREAIWCQPWPISGAIFKSWCSNDKNAKRQRWCHQWGNHIKLFIGEQHHIFLTGYFALSYTHRATLKVWLTTN